MAADDVIDFYTTLTNGGIAGALDTPGDTLTVTGDGTVDIDSAVSGPTLLGIDPVATDTTVTNDGTVDVNNTTATGAAAAAGVASSAGPTGVTVTNNGLVTVTTYSPDYLSIAAGITASNGWTVTNAGSVVASASAGAPGAAAAIGVAASASDTMVANSGSIEVTVDGGVGGASGAGVWANIASNVSMTNSGLVRVDVTNSDGGGDASGLDTTIVIGASQTNTGTIEASSETADEAQTNGLRVSGSPGAVQTNVGDIFVSATSTYSAATAAGIFSNSSSDAMLTNSGAIVVEVSHDAIDDTAHGYGLYASGSDRAWLGNSGSIDITVTSTNADSNARAYGLRVSDSDDTVLENTGDITTTVYTDFSDSTSAYAYGLYIDGDRGSAVNTGDIFNRAFSGEGASVYGLRVDGDGGYAENSGTITNVASSDNNTLAWGIFSVGDEDNEAVNSGVIDLTATATDQAGAWGIDMRTAGSRALNSGTIDISVSGYRGSATGMQAYKSGRLTNTGSIDLLAETQDNGTATGINNIEGSAMSFNDGTITVEARSSESFASAYGIYSYNFDYSTAENTGAIEARAYGDNAGGATGIYMSAPSGYVRNSGSITTGAWDNGTPAEADAIRLGTNNASLYLDAPSYLGGLIAVDADLGNTTTITTGASHSILWDLAGIDNDELIVDDSLVAAFSDTGDWATASKIATFDPTLFAARTSILADRSGTLASVTRGRLDARCAADSALPQIEALLDGDNAGCADDHETWAAAFGRDMAYAGTDSILDHGTQVGGIAAGIDFAHGDTTLGIAAGYGVERFDASSAWTPSRDDRAEGLFATAYGRTMLGSAILDVDAAGGLLRHDDRRFVNDNLAQDETGFYDGAAWRLATYDSTWASVGASLATNLDALEWTFTPRIGARYSAEWIDGYAETGGDASATVGAQNVGVAEGFVEVALRKQIRENTVFTGRTGYLARATTGDDAVTVSLLGETQDLPAGADDGGMFYLGGALDLDLGDGAAIRFAGTAFLDGGVPGYEASATVDVRF